MIRLSQHDQELFERAVAAIRQAIVEAEMPPAVAKKIAAESMRHRNRGRSRARRRHEFQGICEASGLPLDKADAVLDELEPEKGYAGRVRWVCRNRCPEFLRIP